MIPSNCDILLVTQAPFPARSATTNHLARICRGLQLQGCTPAIIGVAASAKLLTGKYSKWEVPFECVEETVPRRPFFIFKRGQVLHKLMQPRIQELINSGTIRAILFYGSSYSAFDKLINICLEHRVLILTYEYEYPMINWLALVTGEYLDRKKYIKRSLPKASGIIGISSFWQVIARKQSIPSIIIPSYLSDEIEILNKGKNTTEIETRDVFHLVRLGHWAVRECPCVLFEALKTVHNKGIPIHHTAIGQIGNNPLERKAVRMYKTDPLLQKIVTVTGWVDDNEKDKLLASASAFIHLRRQNVETQGMFPTRLPEYLAYARPVIVSDAGDIARYMEHKKNAWLIPEGNSPEALSDAIIALYRDKKLANSIGNAGYERAIQCFSIEHNGARLFNFITTISNKSEICR